ncbi:ATP-dependent DNA helicase RecG [hydrothermal vent metagenome]|uniref:ATP-dependent DNA helicase RecG n=1 Tax=hydrothermal vent metagenome TaxID=652676 RepID=A0A3B0VDX3_9ZZZZ
MQLTKLKGIGEKTAQKLALLGIEQVNDLLFHLPLRYQDKTRITYIADLSFGQTALIEGKVQRAYLSDSRKPMLVCEIDDGSRTIALKFFNFYYSQRVKMKPGANIRAYGEARYGKYMIEMLHPEYQHFAEQQLPLENSLTAIYPKSEGINQSTIQKAMNQVIKLLNTKEISIKEFLPDEILQQLQLPNLADALIYVHQPPADADTSALIAGTHLTQQRLILEEILAHLLAMKQIKHKAQECYAPELPIKPSYIKTFKQQLSFQLTNAQKRVIQEIHQDMQNNHPMQRLLQGDVGSGKTVVAALAILAAFSQNHQSVMMAPTEILAEQHYHTLKAWFDESDIVFLSGAIKGKKRIKALIQIENGAKLVIGTHALFQKDVVFNCLGVVIIDEQHRFGVHQRLALRNKGQFEALHPHMLIMTATPIPRTLAQTAYANLDISVIDELPPGRQEISTLVISNAKMPQIAERIKANCQQGQQAYWVCTLIDESEVLRAKAATNTYEELQQWFPSLRIGLVHGRLKSGEKQTIMSQFKSQQLDLLVATTVIEVGVDVPNASLMVIENAERLGLSQLHQLRGRVGRGNKKSHCVLMYQPPLGNIARERLNIMRKTNDGFIIAREDLKIRGAGELLGSKQKGNVQFRLADLERDKPLFQQAQSLASELITQYPEVCQKIIDRWIVNHDEISNV